MKTTAASLLFPMILVTGACAGAPPRPDTTPTAAASAEAASSPGVQGRIATASYSATATVSGIDRSTRRVTLSSRDGSTVSFVAGPEVRNFDQLKIGDRVTATVDTELVIAVRKGGPPIPQGVVMVQRRAAEGDRPGVVSVTAMQGVARITRLDTARREATLLFSDGSTQTFPVRPGIDLTTISVGDEVVFRATEAHSIVVGSP